MTERARNPGLMVSKLILSDLVDLEICLAVLTYGTYFGSLCADYDVAADPALPDSDGALLEYLLCLHILKKLSVALLMALLDCSDLSESVSKIVETFLVSFFGHAVIHVSPLIVLAFCCSKKVSCAVTDVTELLEPYPCMLLLIEIGRASCRERV